MNNLKLRKVTHVMICLALAMAMFVAMMPCTVAEAVKVQNDPVQVNNDVNRYVKLNKKSVSIEAGDSYMLKLGNVSGKNVKWKSSKKSVATVKNGKVTAKKVGKATIIATYKKKTYKCKVTVVESQSSAVLEQVKKFEKVAKTNNREGFTELFSDTDSDLLSDVSMAYRSMERTYFKDADYGEDDKASFEYLQSNIKVSASKPSIKGDKAVVKLTVTYPNPTASKDRVEAKLKAIDLSKVHPEYGSSVENWCVYDLAYYCKEDSMKGAFKLDAKQYKKDVKSRTAKTTISMCYIKKDGKWLIDPSETLKKDKNATDKLKLVLNGVTVRNSEKAFSDYEKTVPENLWIF
ncbi:MAG: Ig-like domain-containing protein [Clostridiales bacterium]|nr:Ig-like domain-containing protein [Clostridiales bacterium]